MTKKNYFWSLLTIFMVSLLGVGFTSCTDDFVRPDVLSADFSAEGGSRVIRISSNTSWSIGGAPSWLSISPMSGKKEGTITLYADENTSQNSRNCTLSISGGDDYSTISVTQAGRKQETRVRITNNSVYSLSRFRVVFVNSQYEKLTDRDFGTLDPGDYITADIPTAATTYYMATYLNDRWFFSPDYDVTYTNLNLSTSEIGNWSTNSNRRNPKTE